MLAINLNCKSEEKSFKINTFEKSKEKLVPWIEMCNHYNQNKSDPGESRTKR